MRSQAAALAAFAALAVCGASADVRPSVKAELVRAAGVWVVRFAPPAAVQSVMSGLRSKGKAAPRVACFVRKGRWLSGLLGPDGRVEIRLADEDIAAIGPGPNVLTVQTPGWGEARIPFDAAPLFRQDADAKALARERQRVVFPPETGSSGVRGTAHASKCEGVSLLVAGVSVTVAAGAGPAFQEIPVNSRARKVYVLSRLRETATPRLSLRASDGRILLPEVVPCGSGEAGMQVFVLDLGEEESLEALVLEPPVRGKVEIHSVSLLGRLRPGAASRLSARALRMAAGEPIPLFAFDTPTLSGWEIRGKGWGVTDTVGEPFGRKGASRYFADSKADGGEPMTGTILSPPFVLNGGALSFLANGHSAKNYYALVDAATGAELRRSPVPEKTGPFEKIRWDVTDLRGRRVRFMAVDEDTRTGFAWLAFDDITLEP